MWRDVSSVMIQGSATLFMLQSRPCTTRYSAVAPDSALQHCWHTKKRSRQRIEQCVGQSSRFPRSAETLRLLAFVTVMATVALTLLCKVQSSFLVAAQREGRRDLRPPPTPLESRRHNKRNKRSETLALINVVTRYTYLPYHSLTRSLP